MKTIPVRQIASTSNAQNISGRFSIRIIEQVLNGNDLVHDLHKHDFYFVLALQQGTGIHEIDFIQYEIQDYSIFILRPGQVHRLALKANTPGRWHMTHK
jgi:AraC family transcriptional activator of pobA